MSNRPLSKKVNLPQHKNYLKFFCPVCGKLEGYLDTSSGDIYIWTNPMDTCYRKVKDKGPDGAV